MKKFIFLLALVICAIATSLNTVRINALERNSLPSVDQRALERKDAARAGVAEYFVDPKTGAIDFRYKPTPTPTPTPTPAIVLQPSPAPTLTPAIEPWNP